MHALSVMAELIAGRFGVRVKFYAGGPKTDGNCIWLPHLPFSRWVSEKVRTLFRGHLFHEIAHILETTFGLKPRDPIEATPLFHTCANSIEDPRIEVRMAQRYPYTQADLVESYAVMIERDECRKGDQGPEDALACFLVYAGFVEYAHYGVLRPVFEGATKALASHIGDTKVQGLLDLVLARYPSLQSTLDVHDLVREVFDFLDIKLPPPQPQCGGGGGGDPQGEPQQGEADGESEGAPGDDAQAEPQEGKGKPGQKPEQTQEPSAAGGSDEDDQDGKGNQDGDAQAKSKPGEEEGDEPESESQTGQGKSESGESDNNSDAQSGQDGESGQSCQFDPHYQADGSPTSVLNLFDLFDGVMGEELEAHGTGQTTEQVELHVVPVAGGDHHKFQVLLAAGMKTVGVLAARLMRLLSVMKTPTTTPAYSGRLRASRAYRFATGDAKLFRRKQESVVPTCAMSLITDLTGSMKGKPAKVAAEATAAVAEAARRARIPCEVLGFEEDKLYVFQSFAEQPMAVRHRIGKMPAIADAGGGTPMGEAMYRGAMRMVVREEQRKLIIVVTDGLPNNRPLTEEVLAMLKATPGIEVIGVGIGNDAVVGLFPAAVVIKEVDELGPALFGILRDRFLRPLH